MPSANATSAVVDVTSTSAVLNVPYTSADMDQFLPDRVKLPVAEACPTLKSTKHIILLYDSPILAIWYCNLGNYI